MKIRSGGVVASLWCGLAVAAAPAPIAPTVFEPGVISTAGSDTAPAFTPDGKTLFFSRGNNAGTAIFISHKQGAHWSKPVIAPFSGAWCDMEPSVSPDGTYLLFTSNRPAKAGDPVLDGRWSNKDYKGLGGQLWRVDIKPSGFGEAVRLPDAVNISTSVFAPAVFKDGSVMLMSPDEQTNRFRLYKSAYKDGQFLPAERLSFSKTDATDVDAAVSADGSFIVFGSTRPPAQSMDIFIVFQEGDGWGVPIHLGPDVNSAGSDAEARLSPDGKTLYFSSDRMTPVRWPRPAAEQKADFARMETYDNGMYNIWQVSLAPWLEQKH